MRNRTARLTVIALAFAAAALFAVTVAVPTDGQGVVWALAILLLIVAFVIIITNVIREHRKAPPKL